MTAEGVSLFYPHFIPRAILATNILSHQIPIKPAFFTLFQSRLGIIQINWRIMQEKQFNHNPTPTL